VAPAKAVRFVERAEAANRAVLRRAVEAENAHAIKQVDDAGAASHMALKGGGCEDGRRRNVSSIRNAARWSRRALRFLAR